MNRPPVTLSRTRRAPSPAAPGGGTCWTAPRRRPTCPGRGGRARRPSSSASIAGPPRSRLASETWSLIQPAVEHGQLAGQRPRRRRARPSRARSTRSRRSGSRRARGAIGAAIGAQPSVRLARVRRSRAPLVTAPSDADDDERRVLGQHAASCSAAAGGVQRGAPRGRARRPATSRSSALRVDVDRRSMSPSSTSAIGPPSAASGATCPIIRPWVPPENRPSVSSATRLAQPLAHERAGDARASPACPGPPTGPS